MNYPLLYLEHLSQRDVEVLATTAGCDPADLKRQIVERPETFDRLLSSRRLFEEIFDPTQELGDPGVSSFLAFGAIVGRAADDLQTASYLPEWSAPGKRLPVFDVEPLRRFFENGAHRYFLIEFLESFNRVASGSYLVKTKTGYQRRRFNELDPLRLAEMVEMLPPIERPGGYRRLGDVALFLCGILPDHTASHPLPVSHRERLARSAAIGPTAALVEEEGVSFLETAGAGWYRRAVEEAETLMGGGPSFLRAVADRFSEARRILNYLADRYLFPRELGLIGPPG